MNDFNRRYEFDRARRSGRRGSRLLTLLILLAVLAVTGAIIYFFVLPHEKPVVKPGSNTAKPETVPAPPAPTPVAPPAPVAPATNSADPAKNEGEDKDPNAPGEVNNTAEEEIKKEAEAQLDQGTTTVTVLAGDTLEKLASRHHTTVESIKHFNGLKDNTIRVGQKLKIIPGPWRITVIIPRNELVLEHAPNGTWRTFRICPADARNLKGVGISEFAVSFLRRRPDWIAADGRKFKYGEPENPYGEYLIMLARRPSPDRPLRGYGIHGVDDKTSNLKNCGRGCIHVGSSDIELLYYLVCPGSEVTVISGETVRNVEK